MSENTSDRLEKKLDSLIQDVSYVKATITEREKTEILRNEVVTQAFKTQDTAMANIDKRVCKLENNQDRVAWLIISTVILAILGVIIAVNVIK